MTAQTARLYEQIKASQKYTGGSVQESTVKATSTALEIAARASKRRVDESKNNTKPAEPDKVYVWG